MRYTEATCRLRRRGGMKLFLRGDRCYIDKCAFVRRSCASGRHGAAKKRLSNYGVQLREKQKVRRIYEALENQFRAYYEKADHMKGIISENLLKLLEVRLGNIVCRLGCGVPRAEARQLINHGHFLTNGKKIGTPPYRASVNSGITVTEKNRGTEKFRTFIENPETLPKWLEVNVEGCSGKTAVKPSREDIDVPVNEALIVELYSK